MNILFLKDKIKLAGYFIPVRIRFVLLVLMLLLAASWLTKNNALPETSRSAIINLFISVSLWFALSVIIVAFFTAFLPWVFFLLNRKNKRSRLKIKIAEKENILNESQKIQVDISNVIQPLFGYVRLRLFYDGKNVSPKFSPIASQSKKQFFSMQIKGIYNWPVKHIKEYDIESSLIYFEDFFQFFSFASQLSVSSNFFTQPPPISISQLMVQPKKN